MLMAHISFFRKVTPSRFIVVVRSFSNEIRARKIASSIQEIFDCDV